MDEVPTITIDRRFHGPANSANGGYACGRVAAFLDGVARVRLHLPPPLDVSLDVLPTDGGVRVVDGETTVAEAWSARLGLDVPPPPGADAAERASRGFAGFRSHRFRSCFVCGVDREPSEGLRIFAGPVEGRNMVACTWTPAPDLSRDGRRVDPVYVWAVLDCPGGFSFPHPESGTILLGELTVEQFLPVPVGTRHVVTGWEIRREGRKHYTGTALFSESGACLAAGHGIWFEVAHGPGD